MEIEYAAPPAVRAVIESLGRTEDVRLSPTNRRLAVAGFGRNRITVFAVEIVRSGDTTEVSLGSALSLSSPALKKPHGVDFIDDETVIVANREGGIAILRIPDVETGVLTVEAPLIRALGPSDLVSLVSPGSVSVARTAQNQCEILVCNNYVDTVSRHILDLNEIHEPGRNEVLLRKWLHVPDGVTASPGGKWIAVSMHGTHSVFLYENVASLNENSYPSGVLRGVSFPHGIRFTADGRQLYVADAGATEVHIYAVDDHDWRGVHYPERSVSLVDEQTFLRGHAHPEEGGPKGLDISLDSNVLVITTEFQPLSFFDLRSMAGDWMGVGGRQDGAAGLAGEDALAPTLPDEKALAVNRELNVMELEHQAHEASIGLLTNSLSWRVTAPFRQFRSMLRGKS